ncbi:MAG: DUF1737 domain-containing protein [Hyphomicrobiales bacterium]
MTGILRYRRLTGPDDRSFCERVSKALDEGYELYGSPSVTYNGERVIAAQALILKSAAKPSTGSQRRSRSRSATRR